MNPVAAPELLTLHHPLHINLNRWHHYQRNPLVQVDALWRNWLLDQGSLTQRLINASNGAFQVRKLRQGWQRQVVCAA